MNTTGIRILIVEDDKDLSNIIRDYLSSEDYEIHQAYSGNQAVELIDELKPTLVILDIMLEDKDGIELCRFIRKYSHCPIIMISAKSSDADKLLALGFGADDYLTKPFSMVELLGRVKSHIRRYLTYQGAKEREPEEEKTRDILAGELTIHLDAYTVEARGKALEFTSREFQLLAFFAKHPGQVFTKQQLLEAVWGESEFIDDNTIAVYVGRLREKLAKEKLGYIKTVWGVGYRWEI